MQENQFENAVCKMEANLTRPQRVKFQRLLLAVIGGWATKDVFSRSGADTGRVCIFMGLSVTLFNKKNHMTPGLQILLLKLLGYDMSAIMKLEISECFHK